MASRRPRFDSYRVRDLLIAVPLLILSLPVQLAVALLIRAGLGSPVLFRQPRPGLHGVPFQLVKFRTMRHPPPDPAADTDQARLTRLGRLLRATSLDELPNLVNVVRGEMSLVGPRPLLMEYLDRYTSEQDRRHQVRPGMTGLAQVLGRNGLAWDDRLRIDVFYVDRRSHLLDARILAATVLVVLRRAGVSAPGHATMPRFAPGRPGSVAPSEHDQPHRRPPRRVEHRSPVDHD